MQSIAGCTLTESKSACRFPYPLRANLLHGHWVVYKPLYFLLSPRDEKLSFLGICYCNIFNLVSFFPYKYSITTRFQIALIMGNIILPLIYFFFFWVHVLFDNLNPYQRFCNIFNVWLANYIVILPNFNMDTILKFYFLTKNENLWK